MGAHIISAFQKLGNHNITALTRPDSDSPMPSGINIVKADYSNSSSLVAALTGQDALIITMSAQAPASSSLALVEAAAAAKVPWVMPNAFGVDWDNKALGEETGLGPRFAPVLKRIEELGVSKWVALACGFWYEWSLSGTPMGMGKDMYGFDLKNKQVTFLDGGDTKMNTSTWPQAGLAVAKVFSLKTKPDGPEDKSATLEGFANKFVYCSSFFVNQKDMLASVIRVQGGSEKDWKITNESSKERFEGARKEMQAGNMAAFARMLYSRGMYPGDGDFRDKLNNEVLGLPVEDIDQATKAAFEYGQIAI